MFSKIRKSKFLIFFNVAFDFIGYSLFKKNTIKSNKQLSKTQVGYISTTPTFFFHGWGSSVNAESHMVNAAQEANVTKDVMTAIVDKNGNVKLSGHISKNAQNPIIKVGFLDNHNHNYQTDARFAYNAITSVQTKYPFTKMNLVGHSMGNMDILFMLLYYGQRKKNSHRLNGKLILLVTLMGFVACKILLIRIIIKMVNPIKWIQIIKKIN